MKKISERTLTAINRLSASELENLGVIQRAKNGGYICPFCSNGTGADGTGIKPLETDSHTGWLCFKCGTKCNNLAILASHFGLDKRRDFVSIVEKACELASIPLEYDNAPKIHWRNSQKATPKPAAKAEPQINPAELELIREDLRTSDAPLRQFVDQCGGTWRGLPFELLKRNGCKFISNWTPPKIRVAKRYSTATPRLLVPCSDSAYLARLTCELERFDEQAQKFVREKQHAGTKKLFLSDDNVLNSDDIVFCVEGYIDAMSIEFAGFSAVALGGANEIDKLIEAAAELPQKPQIVIFLDGDESGRKAAPKLKDGLLGVGCPCVVRFLTDEDSKLDCNEILQEQGKEKLRETLQQIIDGALAEMAAVAAEIEKRRTESRLTDEMINSLFSGGTSDLEYARRLEKFCGDRVRWLVDDERWLIYSDGVWQRRSGQNSAVVDIARDLAETLWQNVENGTENTIAQKFQTAKKINAAIGLLKGFDVRITQDDLDRHSNLLNCLNGVVDLETGKLYPHDARSLLLTQQCRAAYHADATSELVTKFFEDIQPDEQTRAGLKRWLGYNLTAETCEDKFLILTGQGGNGKGVLSATMLELLGDYGCGLPPRALLKSFRPTDPNAASTALNALENARFAISEEMPADGELDCSLVKNLTGGDRINLRRNYSEYRQIRPTAKLNISGNYLPRIENVGDVGILRRMMNMPFNQRFGTADKPADLKLKKKMLLPENLDALLNMLVRESVAWYRDGLIISGAMKQETARHLAQNNFVEEFLSDYYIRGENFSVKAKILIDDLRREYPRETAPLKRADLIKLITRVSGATYTTDNHTKAKIFKGIGKLADDFSGEPVDNRDIPFD